MEGILLVAGLLLIAATLGVIGLVMNPPPELPPEVLAADERERPDEWLS